MVVPSTVRAAISVRELFDGAAANTTLNGQGASLSSGIGFSSGSVWLQNAGGAVLSTNTVNVEASPSPLPGPPAQLASAGAVVVTGGSYVTGIWAVRQLATPVDFASDSVRFFSVRLNNLGDSAVGMGWADGSTVTSNFAGFGTHWNNHLDLVSADAKNSLYTTWGTLDQNLAGNNDGPYAMRTHTAPGTVNGTVFVVGRLTTRAIGNDTLELKLYAGGAGLEQNPPTTWTLTDNFPSSMSASHLLLWANGAAEGQLDAIRIGSSWGDVTGNFYVPPGPPVALVISEFLASNKIGLEDEDGDESDWIEIFNPTEAPVNLLGYYLTDDPAEPRKWSFPEIILQAGERIVVFASDKDRRMLPLHTNFKLSTKAGGYLSLNAEAGGGMLTSVSLYENYPLQLDDISYGYSVSNTVLVSSGSASKVLVPTVANGGSVLGSTWTGATGNEPFNDNSWTSGNLAAGMTGAPTILQAVNLKLRLNANSEAGLTADTSGANHNATNTPGSLATYVETVTDTGSPSMERQGAIQFSALTQSQMTIPAHADFAATQGTISFWMKSAGMAGGGNEGSMIWDCRNGSGNVIVLVGTGVNAGKLFSQPSGSSSFYSTVTVNDNHWHHVAFVYNQAAGGVDTFYIDGIAAGSVTHPNAWTWPAGQQIELGRSHDGYWYKYHGLLDDLRFYNTALSAAQVSQLRGGADDAVPSGVFSLNLAPTMMGINASAFLRVPFTLTNPNDFSGVTLKMRASDGYVAWLNGQQFASFNAPASPAYNSSATANGNQGSTRSVSFTPPSGLLRNGSNVLSIQGLNNGLSDPNFLVSPHLEGLSEGVTANYLTSSSPGETNTAPKTNIGPAITAATDKPARPVGGAGSAPLTINATVKTTLRPLATTNPVQLAYRVLFGAETVINMTPAAGGVYTAQIPTTGLTSGQMLRWRVIATDSDNIQTTAPPFASPTDSDQYYGTVALDGVLTQLPIYHIFVNGYVKGAQTTIDSDGGARGSFFYNDELYDNVFIRIKGDTTRYMTKRAHRVDFNSEHQLKWGPNQSRLKELALNAEYVDPSYSRQNLSFWLHRLSGTGAPNHFPVRVQMNGTFWQLAFHTETADSELLGYMGLDKEGALYSSVGTMAGGGGEKQTRVWEGNSDLTSFVAAMTNPNLAARKSTIYDQVDIPAVINYLAVARLTQEGDDVWANMTVYRHTNTTGEWRIIPFDNNLSWGQLYYGDAPSINNVLQATLDSNKSHPLYGTSTCLPGYSGNFNRFYEAMIQEPTTRAMLLRRMRTIMDAWFQAPGTPNPLIEAQLDALTAKITQEALLDRASWGWPGIGGPYGLGNQPYEDALTDLKNLFITPRRTHFFNTHTSTANVGVGNANSAGIPSAQAASFTVNFGSYDSLPVGSTTQQEEYLQLLNPNAFDADLSGWTLSGGVNFTFQPGTVMNGNGSIYVARNAAAFRQRSVSPKGGETRFVTGPYSGQISARGEVIELRDPAGILVSTITTAATPTPSQQNLRITELNFNPAAPTPTELISMPTVLAGDFEFVELQNIGASPLVLTGAYFSKGISFTFPPGFTLAAGARTVLVANSAAFSLRYPGVANVAGVFAGNLSNQGETLEISDGVGEIILDFSYDPTWLPSSAGGGYTLITKDASPLSSTYGNPTHWTLSGTPGGTPGMGDATFANNFEGWRREHFSAAEITNPDTSPNPFADPNGDPDGDGMTTLGEYAFVRDPLVAEGNGNVTLGSTVVGLDSFVTASVRRPRLAVDLVYRAEFSSNLNVWDPSTIEVGSPVNLNDGTEVLTFRDPIPDPGTRRFVRIVATK